MSGVITATILSNNERMNPEYCLVSIDIIKEVNKIPVAQITLLDGSGAEQEFEISNTDFFKPGNKIEIKLRYEGENKNEETVFKGIIVKHSVQADLHNSLLTIDLKDEAIKLTFERKSVVFRDIQDQEIINRILKNAGLKINSISPTKSKYKEIIQYYCSDWDFILSRADINGQWVLVDDGEITVTTPDLKNPVKHTFEYGINDLHEFEMEADIENQYNIVESIAWDIQKQLNSKGTKAKNFSLSQGDLKPDQLAPLIGAKTYKLITCAELDNNELQSWANAKMIKTRLSMFKGRFKVPGFANIKPGDIMKVDGISKRFNGTTIITAIRHQIDSQGWRTDVQFGLSSNFFYEQNDNIIDAPANGLLPGICSLQIGVIDKYEEDPKKQFRAKVKIPSIQNNGAIWARLASIGSGNKRGIFFRPEAGDEVIVGFINDDPRQAIILGAVYSQKNKLPNGLKVTEKNEKKAIVTKESLSLIFDDENKSIEINTPNLNSLKLSDKNGSIHLEDENHNTIILDKEGIQIKSSKNITIEGKKIEIKGSVISLI
jgi:Rhs element Vgr protein